MRTIYKVSDTGDVQIAMRDVRKDDRFRVVANDPEDHLHGQQDKVYTALDDAAEDRGTWGVMIRQEEGQEGVARYERAHIV